MSMDVIYEKSVKCRKAHECIWCGENIGAGDTVPFIKYVFDGCIHGDHYHPECKEAADKYEFYDDEGFDPYMFERGTMDLRGDA